MTVSRREFTEVAALAAVLPLLARPRSSSGEPAAAPAAPAQQEEPSAEARALGAWVRARYGDRLTANQYAEVVQDIDGALRRAARLNAPALTNADEPDMIFRAYRGG